MTDTQLRAAIKDLVVPNLGIAKAYDSTGVTSDEVAGEILTLFIESQRQLLREVMEHRRFYTDDNAYSGGPSESVEAVPVSVIEEKLKEME